MAEHSSIEWTDATWNPVRGCTKISPGCKHCYAEVFAERFRGVKGHPYEQGFDLRLVPEKLAEPLRWQTPRRCSRKLHRSSRHRDGQSKLAHVSGPDQAFDAHGPPLARSFALRCRSASHLVGRERGESRVRYPSTARPADRASLRTIPVGRTTSRRPRTNQPRWDSLGDRRRRKRIWRTAYRQRMGHIDSRPVPS
jgi:hypothetical protein